MFGVNVAQTHNIPRTTTVLITTDDGGNGSGVVIGPGLILTARHVASIPNRSVTINGKRIPLTLVALDPNSDLGLLRGDFKSPTADIANSNPSVGDAVEAVGFPVFVEVHAQIKTQGEVQNVDDPYVTFNADIAPGNSGGGLFHRNWLGRYELVGINVRVPSLQLSMFSTQMLTYIPDAVSTAMINLFVENYQSY